MKTNPVAAAAMLAALAPVLLLGACDHRMANSALCADFKAAPGTRAGLPTADAALPVDDCLRRWAYSLAGARDDADVVAEAAVGACAAQLTHWGQASVNAPPGETGVSLTTGQPTNPLAEHSAFARARAVLYVVEARAGRCAPPPVTNGAPAGVN